ncbi:MAG: hypothetical protein K0B10_15760 [Vicingaceae bacterium]|nr:hypothetical protein [Vicingaceae bacterium]
MNEEKESISCNFNVNLKIKETQEVFATLEIVCVFDVFPLETVVIKIKGGYNISKKGGYNISNLVLFNLANITTSTARGILFERMKDFEVKDILQ